MAIGDRELEALVDVLVTNGVAPRLEAEVEFGKLLGRLRGRHERDMRDIQIAQLIPQGVELVCERFGGKKRMNQYRASRGRILLKLVQSKST